MHRRAQLSLRNAWPLRCHVSPFDVFAKQQQLSTELCSAAARFNQAAPSSAHGIPRCPPLFCSVWRQAPDIIT
jgi:hypothetical protein